MNKKIVHDALILFAFTIVLGLLLGVVYGVTKPSIDKVNEEKTQKEVADLLGISQSYISRLEKKIMKRLKKEMIRFEQIS